MSSLISSLSFLFKLEVLSVRNLRSPLIDARSRWGILVALAWHAQARETTLRLRLATLHRIFLDCFLCICNCGLEVRWLLCQFLFFWAKHFLLTVRAQNFTFIWLHCCASIRRSHNVFEWSRHSLDSLGVTARHVWEAVARYIVTAIESHLVWVFVFFRLPLFIDSRWSPICHRGLFLHKLLIYDRFEADLVWACTVVVAVLCCWPERVLAYHFVIKRCALLLVLVQRSLTHVHTLTILVEALYPGSNTVVSKSTKRAHCGSARCLFWNFRS